MNFVLDTNAVSEPVKRRPNAGLMEWQDGQNPSTLFITTVSLAEVWSGFHKLPPAHPDYDRIKNFARNLAASYRMLKLDERAAEAWGRISAAANGPVPYRDSFIAAIALSRGCRVVTREAGTFERLGCKVVNPWS